jgi:uncharacterized protein (TIGR03437 family)
MKLIGRLFQCGLMLAPAFCLAQAPPVYTITTIAGQLGQAGNYAGDGGIPTNAFLWGPSDIVFDASGNLYFSDTTNNRIRDITNPGTASAIIDTVAGNGNGGYLGDGSAASNTTTELFNPNGLAFDSQHNLDIADTGNFVIRQISTSGVINTVAGDNSLGGGYSGDDGPATGAQLANPSGVAVDSGGNIYIADPDNNVIRVVCGAVAPVPPACTNLSAGEINTMAGNQAKGASYTGDGGAAINALLNDPVALAVDASGNLYISDSGNNAIRKVDTHGIITTVVGDGTGNAGFVGDGGPATEAELNGPKGIAFDTYGNLYIADTVNSRIRMVEGTGIITTIAGNGSPGDDGDGGVALSAALNFPSGMAVNGGKVYIADYSNNAIRMLTPDAPQINAGGVITAGSFGASPMVAPGSWIEIYGANLAAGSRQWGSADFNGSNAPTSLDSTAVTVGGQPAFVSYISAQQVDVQVPSNINAGTQPFVLKTAFGTSAAYNVTIGATPGVYAPPVLTIGGKQYAGALFANSGTWVLPTGAIPGFTSQPASPGDIITLYGVGFGSVTPAVAAGQLVPSGELTNLTAPVQILFGTTPGTLLYQGLAPGLVGVYQFNVTVPTVAANSALPLVFSQGGVTLPQTLYTAVGN